MAAVASALRAGLGDLLHPGRRARKSLATKEVDPAPRLAQGGAGTPGRCCERAKAARIAGDTIPAWAWRHLPALYEGPKAAVGALDFADLIERTHALLTVRADAAWVLYKLDGGVDHVLLDEAQDTAPDQWDILRALTDEFFAGQGVRGRREAALCSRSATRSSRSILSGRGARTVLAEAGATAPGGGRGRQVSRVPLLESWRSTPEILSSSTRSSPSP